MDNWGRVYRLRSTLAAALVAAIASTAARAIAARATAARATAARATVAFATVALAAALAAAPTADATADVAVRVHGRYAAKPGVADGQLQLHRPHRLELLRWTAGYPNPNLDPNPN